MPMTKLKQSKWLMPIGLFVLILGYYILMMALGLAPPLWVDALIVASLAVSFPWVLGRLGFDPYGEDDEHPSNQTEHQ